MVATATIRGADMPKQKTEEIKKHGDTLEPLIDRTGESTQRRPTDEDARRRDDADKDVLSDDA
jgi:hypothetical protein